MNGIASDAHERYSALIDSQRKARPGDYPEWLHKLSQQAEARFATEGFPDRRSEAWRYTSLTGLLEHDFRPARLNTALSVTDIEDRFIPGLESLRLVFVNGRFVPQLSDLSHIPRGLWATGLADALAHDPGRLQACFGRLTPGQGQAFTDLNLAALADGALVAVEPGVQVERPIEIMHVAVSSEEPQVAQPRHIVALGEAAKATLVERYLSLGGDSVYFNNVVLDLQVEQGASLEHYLIQEESRSAFHVHGQSLRQQAGSHYRGLGLALGGAWSRTEWRADLVGAEAEHRVGGLYVVGDGQLADNHLDIRHEFPACVSREDFRGVLNGKGRGVFDGRVLVQRGAQKTDAQLSNRNLMLSRQAEIDTKPQLEIYADDVACSHGTTVGEIDADTVFYLRSRGIDRQRAQQIVSLGFARAVFEDCGIPGMSAYIEQVVAARLNVEINA